MTSWDLTPLHSSHGCQEDVTGGFASLSITVFVINVRHIVFILLCTPRFSTTMSPMNRHPSHLCSSLPCYFLQFDQFPYFNFFFPFCLISLCPIYKWGIPEFPFSSKSQILKNWLIGPEWGHDVTTFLSITHSRERLKDAEWRRFWWFCTSHSPWV